MEALQENRHNIDDVSNNDYCNRVAFYPWKAVVRDL